MTAPRLRWVAWTVIAIGVAVRVRLYAAARAYWYDEAAVALNLVSRSFVDLLRPLDYRQTAPPLFLWIERAAVLAAGPGERVLRALPLVAGVALLVVMWRVARRLFPDDAALVALALAVFSPMLAYFSNELKPYGTDALVTLLLMAAALRVGERPADRRRWLVLALGGAAATAFSITAPFVLAGVAAYLVLSPQVRVAPRAVVHGAGTAALWGVAAVAFFLVHHAVMDETSPTGAWMHAYWKDAFLNRDPPGLRMRAWIAAFGAIKATFIDEVSRPHEMALLVLAATLGLVRVVRRNGVAAGALVAVPYACLAAAAAVRVYPLGPRLILFAAPITALLLAGGATWPGRLLALRMPRRAGSIAAGVATAAIALVLIAIPARTALSTLAAPPGRNELREMIRDVAGARRDDPAAHPVWVSAGAELSWQFYAGDSLRARDSGAPLVPLAGTRTEVAPGVLVGDWWHGGDRGGVEVQRLRAATTDSCGWLVFALSNDEERAALLRAVAQSGGRVVASRTATGAAVHRVCFGASAPRATSRPTS